MDFSFTVAVVFEVMNSDVTLFVVVDSPWCMGRVVSLE